MKKIITILMAISMILSLSVAVFAEPGNFLVSPSTKLAPELVDVDIDSDCDVEIIIHPYGDRDKLNDEDKKEFEDAYDSIVDADDVNDLNDKIKGDDLAVSDLFGIEVIGCDEDHPHNFNKIEISTESAKNFNSLIAFDGEKWIIIEGASVSGNNLSFRTELSGFTALAIVVNTTDGAPQTGDSLFWIYGALMVVSAAGFVAVCISLKKKKN